jgi:hypothetical protein
LGGALVAKTLKRRLDKIEPLIRERQAKRLAALLFQLEIAEGLLRLRAGLDAEVYAEAEEVFLSHLAEVLEEAYGAGWERYLWITPLSEGTP